MAPQKDANMCPRGSSDGIQISSIIDWKPSEVRKKSNQPREGKREKQFDPPGDGPDTGASKHEMHETSIENVRVLMGRRPRMAQDGPAT
jgi:hypothetical protein